LREISGPFCDPVVGRRESVEPGRAVGLALSLEGGAGRARARRSSVAKAAATLSRSSWRAVIRRSTAASRSRRPRPRRRELAREPRGPVLRWRDWRSAPTRCAPARRGWPARTVVPRQARARAQQSVRDPRDGERRRSLPPPLGGSRSFQPRTFHAQSLDLGFGLPGLQADRKRGGVRQRGEGRAPAGRWRFVDQRS